MDKSCKEILKNIEATIKDLKNINVKDAKPITQPASAPKIEVKTT